MAKTAPKAKKPAAKAAPAKAAKKGSAKAAVKPAVKAAKAAAKPAAKGAKKSPKSAKAKGAKVRKGDQLYCEVCGLVVSIDESCGCAEACDIVCCGEEMQPKK
jgi:hypothetical protein